MAEQGILGIDFGLKNIGIAIASLEAGIPDPLKTVPRQTIWVEIEKIIKDYNVGRIVIGIPLRDDCLKAGREEEIVIAVKAFADEVKSKFKIPVVLWDERFTTQDAEKILRDNKSSSYKPRISSKEKGKRMDHFSAALILEEYLACNQ
jgi:putative holliday junction resolvase